MSHKTELWRTPEWETEYQATLAVNPGLAQAMLETGLPARAAGMILAGESVDDDDGTWSIEDGVVTI